MNLFRLCVLALFGLLAACAKDIPPYVPPHERPVSANEQPWPPGHFLAIAWHDVDDTDPDQQFVAVSTAQLVEQFNWLHANGYQPVSVEQILAAKSGANPGKAPLPDKAVLLTFDDGFRSFYTRVLPLLRAWNWPAVLAPVGVWMDAGEQDAINFGGQPAPRERFLNWDEIAEIAASGLVEIAAHTDRSHHGLLANPQGNTQPAAAAPAWLPTQNRYETPDEFRTRMRADVAAISDKIHQATGKRPRVWVWPYGEASGVTLDIVAAHGYQMALTLMPGLGNSQHLMSVPRIMPTNAPALADFADDAAATENTPLVRSVTVRLDDVYHADPAQTEQQLSALVQRIHDLQLSAVFVQAFGDADAAGNNSTLAAYFPNRHLPMRMDLFNRVAWQLRNRAQVRIYAVLPASLAGLERDTAVALAQDLSRHAIFDGVVFDHALPPALTAALTDTVRAVRGSQIQTMHHLPADALLALDAASLDALYAAHDWIVASVVPVANSGAASGIVPALTNTLAARPGALDKTVFSVATRDANGSVASVVIADALHRLQLRGARHLGIGPDDFAADHPSIQILRPAISTGWYPFAEGHDHED